MCIWFFESQKKVNKNRWYQSENSKMVLIHPVMWEITLLQLKDEEGGRCSSLSITYILKSYTSACPFAGKAIKLYKSTFL